MDLYNYSIDDAIPKKNILANRLPVGRTEKAPVPTAMWNQIKDKKYPSAYAKKNFLNGYFTVSAYEIRLNRHIPIPANSTYEQEVEITNTSTVRRETSTDFQIENTITGGATGEAFNLSNTLCIQYQMHSLNEYCDEAMKRVRETFNYSECDYDRTVVLWDLVKVVALYRVCKNDTIELVGIGDYYDCSAKKTYRTENVSKASIKADNELLCANSENIYHLVDDDMSLVMSSIQGDMHVHNQRCRWQEYLFGTNRGILINPGRHRYVFNPNPHEDRQYNKGQQRWYNQMAEQIEDAVNGLHEWPPTIHNLNVNGTNYTAISR